MTPCTSCPACDGAVVIVRDAEDFAFHRSYRLVRCQSCGLVTVDPVPTDAELAPYYADAFYGQPSSTSGAALRFFYGRRAATVRRHHNKVRRVLDVGCGDGGFLAHLAKEGVDVAGFEPSAAGAARARDRLKRPGNKAADVVNDLAEVRGEFDVVTAWHVLEHVAQPRLLLGQLRSLLAADGIVVLAVPNFDCLEARWGKDAWFHLDVPRHLHHFSPGSLERLVVGAGFDVVDVATLSIEYGPFGLLQTAQNALPGVPRNALYGLLKHGQKLPRLTAAAVLAAAAVGTGPALIGSALQAALGRGSSITVTARPR